MKIYQKPAIILLGTVAEETLGTSVTYYPKQSGGSDSCFGGQEGSTAANCTPIQQS